MPEPARPQPEFERLYAAHRKAVLAYCLRRAAPSDAHDAAAETFAVAWRRMEAVPAGEDALPWLYGVAYRTLANMRRAARRRSRLESKVGAARLAPTPVRPDIQVVRNAEAEAVVQAMERLRPADREVLRLAIWEELPRDQIAQVFGISRDAVNQRYVRAVRRMGKELARAGIHPSGKGGEA